MLFGVNLGIKGGKPNPEIFTKWILFIIFIIVICFLHCSCNPQQKIDKATMLVLTNTNAFDTVGKKYLELNPCNNKITFKTDVVEVHDTTMHFEHYTDSINHTDTIVKVVTVTIKKYFHDTATVIDNQQVKLLSETVIKKDLQIATINGQIIGANNATKEAQGETSKWKLYFFSLLGFIGIVGVLKIIAAVSPSSSTANLLKKLKL